jgi:hypothetical protein
MSAISKIALAKGGETAKSEKVEIAKKGHHYSIPVERFGQGGIAYAMQHPELHRREKLDHRAGLRRKRLGMSRF